MKFLSRKNQAGVAIPFFALTIVPLIGFLALAIDGARLYISKLEQEASAEYAAQVAMEEFIFQKDGVIGSTFQSCKAAAIAKATAGFGGQSYLASSGNASNDNYTILFGFWSGVAFIEIPTPANPSMINAIKVSLRSNTSLLSTLFSRINGIDNVIATSSAIAFYDATRASGLVNPYTIIKQ
jgi:hypothetical protein